MIHGCAPISNNNREVLIEFLEVFEQVQSYYDYNHWHAVHNMTILRPYYDNHFMTWYDSSFSNMSVNLE